MAVSCASRKVPGCTIHRARAPAPWYRNLQQLEASLEAAYQNITKPTVITHISSCQNTTRSGRGRVNAHGQPSPQSLVRAICTYSSSGSTALLCRQLAGLQPHPHGRDRQLHPHTPLLLLHKRHLQRLLKDSTKSLKSGRPKEAAKDLTLLLSPISAQGTCMQ